MPIRIAKEQKSVSLEKRAEGTCAEYHLKKRTRQEESIPANLFVRSSRSLRYQGRPHRFRRLPRQSRVF